MEPIITVAAVLIFAALLGLPALHLMQINRERARFARLRARKSPSILKR